MVDSPRRNFKKSSVSFGNGLYNYQIGTEEVAQRVAARLKIVKGEWFLDPTIGIPYFEYMKNRLDAKRLIETDVQQTILGTQGVESIKSIVSSINHETRVLTLDITITAASADATINVVISPTEIK